MTKLMEPNFFPFLTENGFTLSFEKHLKNTVSLTLNLAIFIEMQFLNFVL